MGNKKVVYGVTVFSGTVTGGDVETGLRDVEFFHVDPNGGTQVGSSMNEDLPLRNTGGTVTVVTEDTDGTIYWFAVGK